MSKVVIKGDASGTGTLTIAAPNTNSDVTFNLPTSGGTVMTTSTSLNSSQIPDGSITTAKLSATGTPSSSTFLRGDGSWQTISTTPTTDQVLTATAAASEGAVGTYAWAGTVNADSRTAFGSTLAGSSLRTQGVASRQTSSVAVCAGGSETTLSGTWKCMGTKPSREILGGATDLRNMTLWLRIS